ncbi:MAG: MBL fold metallo-hydrolase [Anaerolineaceae bacterium]|nr:MBL fold metallo-hydrolase [Anaerolineaceae bacterium]
MTSLNIIPFVLGPIDNNSFIIFDQATKKAAIVDPSFDSLKIMDVAKKNNLEISQIWCTHAHFDHIAGINEIIPLLSESPEIFLHKDDLSLWNANGGAKLFGFPFEINHQPTHLLGNSENFYFGENRIETKFTPGHTPGHIIYYLPNDDIVFCGDLIFRNSVGRTDLPGGNHLQLLQSIDQVIKPLPDQTRLLSGHGPETTVGFEKKHNPFL